MSTAVEMPRKRCTSMTLSMPNARLRERIRLGRTVAHTSAVRANSPVNHGEPVPHRCRRRDREPQQRRTRDEGPERCDPGNADPAVPLRQGIGEYADGHGAHGGRR